MVLEPLNKIFQFITYISFVAFSFFFYAFLSFFLYSFNLLTKISWTLRVTKSIHIMLNTFLANFDLISLFC